MAVQLITPGRPPGSAHAGRLLGPIPPARAEPQPVAGPEPCHTWAWIASARRKVSSLRRRGGAASVRSVERSAPTPQLVPASARNSSNTGPFSMASSARMARAAGPPSITR